MCAQSRASRAAQGGVNFRRQFRVVARRLQLSRESFVVQTQPHGSLARILRALIGSPDEREIEIGDALAERADHVTGQCDRRVDNQTASIVRRVVALDGVTGDRPDSPRTSAPASSSERLVKSSKSWSRIAV